MKVGIEESITCETIILSSCHEETMSKHSMFPTFLHPDKISNCPTCYIDNLHWHVINYLAGGAGALYFFLDGALLAGFRVTSSSSELSIMVGWTYSIRGIIDETKDA